MLLVLLSDWWHSSSNRPSKTGQPGDSGRIVGDSDEGLLDGTPRRILRVARTPTRALGYSFGGDNSPPELAAAFARRR
jgi:hypothetical protein